MVIKKFQILSKVPCPSFSGICVPHHDSAAPVTLHRTLCAEIDRHILFVIVGAVMLETRLRIDLTSAGCATAALNPLTCRDAGTHLL